ncbi:MAG: hypothetical protein E7359_00230 [Clostridiales bacterium]|nr:hypothetical protein [Clostridiales bacterium]
MKKIFIKDLKVNKSTNLKCWIANKRQIKDKLFLDVYDSTGSLECFASKNETNNFDLLKKLNRESCIELQGFLSESIEKKEFLIEDFKIYNMSTLKISPYPNEPKLDVLNDIHYKQVIKHQTFYIRNKKLSALYFIKSVFKKQMRDYFWKKGFIEFEPPTLTKQTLYDDSGAIWLNSEGQNVSLSRCATFHLEPALIAYEKLFTITNSHANEKVKSNRYLVEYMHMKAEMAWFNLEELIIFAQDLYYNCAKETIRICANKFKEFLSTDEINQKLEKLNPKNHILITYDEAINILKSYNINLKYGKSLTAKQEEIITKHFNENFVWVKYVPYTVEGFMFKRKPDNNFLTLTCDLIAPNGYGEILGCAEKMTDYDEILKSLEQKGKKQDYDRYKDYLDLHKLGLPPHGGIGMGIERAVRYLVNVNHVKYLKPFAIIKNTQINH